MQPCRSPIVAMPTPLVRLDQISRDLGIDLWIKRDDLAGPSFGGNKARQLEYYFGAAHAQGADTILITGAVQSNFVRTAAAVASSKGMKAIVQLEDRVPGQGARYHQSGNVVLNHLFGAEVLSYPDGEDEAGADANLFAVAERLRGQGRVPYVIPLGADHPPLGALGYMDAASELVEQDAGFDVVVVASGSGATHLGLLAGLRAVDQACKVVGSCVRRPEAAQRARLEGLLLRLKALTSRGDATRPNDITLWDGALAPGYGRVSDAGTDALRMMARGEGQVLDPVYTAKAFAAIPDLVADGTIPKDARVCFVHTGGLASVFAYDEALAAAITPPEQTQ